MDDEARRARIGELVKALNARDMEWFDALYDDDVVVHWPQSGEVIRGKKNIRELREAYPTPPTATLRRIVGAVDLWAIEADFDYDGDRFPRHRHPPVPRWAGGARDGLLRRPVRGAGLAGEVGRASSKLDVELTGRVTKGITGTADTDD
jgi:hypothetical protein